MSAGPSSHILDSWLSRREFHWYGLCAPFLAALSGCQNQSTNDSSTALPYDGLNLIVTVPTGWGFKELWEIQLREWSARTGAQADVQEVDMADASQPLLDSSRKSQLLIFPWVRRGELLSDQQLKALPPESLTDLQLAWEDLFKGLRNRLAESDAGPLVVPLGAPALICYYRADLLEKAGRKPPETWAEYQLLLDELEQWAPGLSAAEPWSPEFRATLFLARALPFVKHSGHYSTFFEVGDGSPLIDSPGFVKALEVAQAALKKLPPEVLTWGPVDCRNQIVSGKVALAIGLETGPGSPPLIAGAAAPQGKMATQTVARPEGASLGFSAMPGAAEVYNTTFDKWVQEDHGQPNFATLTGFAGLCAAIPSSTSDQETAAAANLLAALLLDPTAVFPAGSVSLCRESQALESGLWVGKELGGSEAGRYVATTARCLRSPQLVAELPVLGHEEFRATLTRGLQDAIDKQADPAIVLRSIATSWEEILQRLGKDKVLASYRRSLGLTKLAPLD